MHWCASPPTRLLLSLVSADYGTESGGYSPVTSMMLLTSNKGKHCVIPPLTRGTKPPRPAARRAPDRGRFDGLRGRMRMDLQM